MGSFAKQLGSKLTEWDEEYLDYFGLLQLLSVLCPEYKREPFWAFHWHDSPFADKDIKRSQAAIASPLLSDRKSVNRDPENNPASIAARDARNRHRTLAEKTKLFQSELQRDAKRVDDFYTSQQATLQQHLDTLKASTQLLEHDRDDEDESTAQNLKVSFTRLFRKLHNLLSFGTLNQTGFLVLSDMYDEATAPVSNKKVVHVLVL